MVQITLVLHFKSWSYNQPIMAELHFFPQVRES